jgi:hypothetical protein
VDEGFGDEVGVGGGDGGLQVVLQGEEGQR